MLITGALDFVVRPLAPLFDDVVCATMRAEDGRYTGELDDVPPTGEARAQAMADYAAAEGLDLAESVAYADSASDLPMLEAVGFPVAVNPETRSRRSPAAGGWWSSSIRHPAVLASSCRWRPPWSVSGEGPARALGAACFAAARVAGSILPGKGATVGPSA